MMQLNVSSKLSTLGLLALLALSACNPKKAGEGGESAAAAASASATTKDGKAEKPKGPCEELAAKFCAEAGEKSAMCTNSTGILTLLSDKTCKEGIKDFASTQAKLKEKAKDCIKLVDVLCAGVGKTTKSCEMVKEKTKTFPPEQCTQMLGHTEEIIANLKSEEMKNQPLSPELQTLIAAQGAPSFGPEAAAVTVVEFSDFECPYCSRAADVMTQLKAKYGTKVRFVFRQFPLGFHQSAQGAAEASMAANAQGKFWEYHDLMFKNQKKLSLEDLTSYAQQVGLNMTQFKQDMDSHKFAEQVKADIALGGQVAVSGTPTLFINGARAANPTDFSMVSSELDKILGS
jgi:protein-disulfide isomerase